MIELETVFSRTLPLEAVIVSHGSSLHSSGNWKITCRSIRALQDSFLCRILVLCLDVFYDASCARAAESSISLSVLGTAAVLNLVSFNVSI